MKKWALKNREAFERDVLQDFCLASGRLCEQFTRAGQTMTVSFPVLRDLVGEPWNKGLLWRLKDKAHHLFRTGEKESPASLLLDWTLGYIFHESLKLMEHAHQCQHYVPRLAELRATPLSPEIAAVADSLSCIQEGIRKSMRHEVARLDSLLFHARRLFILYFSGRAGHRPLARFLNDNEMLVRHAFQTDYASFVASVYGDEPERMHIEAAHSLVESAHKPAAGKAIRAALLINPASREALALQKVYGL